jgi:cysteine protease IpaJ
VQRFRKRQQQDDSCGASSLLCAALELGIREFSQTDRSVFSATGVTLSASNHAESTIVELTRSTRNSGLGVVDAGHLYPHDFAVAARSLSLRGSLYLNPNAILATALGLYYRDSGKMALESGVPLFQSTPPDLRLNQRLLKVFLVEQHVTRRMPRAPRGLHYVLLRPDGSVMDPATGWDFDNLRSMRPLLDGIQGRYVDSGIAVLIEPRERMATDTGFALT